ncbi:MAG: CoA-binding protein [Candidatus Eisenbacteria bacterium]|uniref:CoA-binding protein n=1 Tax=Eiseniibacteriota bacterium TaxID=2212470 RepID=A0A948RR24_UNCEI|nr:CoA-binding protein [Candidatus Eisenbacteria bacterium]MBU1949018.1 CoA-binding protein [Candidatus Eisenbacteria bacterium]MBU2689448.1 CoA-binding protein [Candidatus Eisenbacteria bacterium]
MSQIIAIIGASPDRKRYANKAIRAWQKQGWTVIPVNPTYEEIEGLKTYPTLADIPGPVNVASLYVSPRVGITILDAIAAKGIKDVYVNPGAESDDLVKKAVSLGLQPIVACSILAIGEHPDAF